MPSQVEASNLRKGSYVIIEDEPCEVRGVSKSSPGKHGSAKIKIKARGVFDEKDRHVTKPGDKMMMSPDVDKRIGQIVSREGDIAQVMDMDSYETNEMELPEDLDAGEGEEIEFKLFDDRVKVLGIK